MVMKPKNNTEQPAKDLCYTPPYATQALCDFVGDLGDKTVWECAAGEGHMVDVLEPKCQTVIPTDLQQGIDFIHDDINENFDCIITNPPYSATAKYGFIKRCVELGKDFALLMPLETIGAKKAQEAFAEIGGVGVLLFDTRIDYQIPNKGYEGGGAQFPTAWFISGFGVERNKMFFRSISEEKTAFKKTLKAVAKKEKETSYGKEYLQRTRRGA